MPNYSYTDSPGTNDIDTVRFLTNDRTDGQMRLSDEEITYLVTTAGNADVAAADAAEVIAGILATKANKMVGHLRTWYTEQSKNFMDLAERLRARVARYSNPAPVLTQTSRDPLFAIGMDDAFTQWTPPQVASGFYLNGDTDGDSS